MRGELRTCDGEAEAGIAAVAGGREGRVKQLTRGAFGDSTAIIFHGEADSGSLHFGANLRE